MLGLFTSRQLARANIHLAYDNKERHHNTKDDCYHNTLDCANGVS